MARVPRALTPAERAAPTPGTRALAMVATFHFWASSGNASMALDVFIMTVPPSLSPEVTLPIAKRLGSSTTITSGSVIPARFLMGLCWLIRL